MPTIVCPECGQVNQASATNCTQCRVPLQDALDYARQLEAIDKNQPYVSDEKQAQARLRHAIESMIVTTTPTIQGRTITQYFGIVSSVVVLGSGFLSEFKASLADAFGSRSGAFQTKLSTATTEVLNEIRVQAAECGANAIVGLDLDYMVPDNNMFVVTANGTAVATTVA